jgi:hypothetical protein
MACPFSRRCVSYVGQPRPDLSQRVLVLRYQEGAAPSAQWMGQGHSRSLAEHFVIGTIEIPWDEA